MSSTCGGDSNERHISQYKAALTVNLIEIASLI